MPKYTVGRGQRYEAQCRLVVIKSIALPGAVALLGAAMFFVSNGSLASAATPAKTVCNNAIASKKPLTNVQIAACKKANIKVPKAASNARKVTGTLVTLGAGQFVGGSDVKAGLYDVTPGPGESGNFSTKGQDPLTYSYNEILGTAGGFGVPSVRTQIAKGDQISISGLSAVTFTPVTAPYVTSHMTITLGAGTWVVGQDIGPGRYVGTPGPGQSGNFSVKAKGFSGYVNEILGSNTSYGQVPSVTVNLAKGSVISISGMSQVVMTAK
jgi:hypothetical protein